LGWERQSAPPTEPLMFLFLTDRFALFGRFFSSDRFLCTPSRQDRLLGACRHLCGFLLLVAFPRSFSGFSGDSVFTSLSGLKFPPTQLGLLFVTLYLPSLNCRAQSRSRISPVFLKRKHYLVTPTLVRNYSLLGLVQPFLFDVCLVHGFLSPPSFFGRDVVFPRGWTIFFNLF